MNIVIYARFSSHSQNEQSIEGQLKTCYEYAKNNNYDVIEEYIDRAVSGTTDNRPEFQRMIEDSNKKNFQYVLVYQLDRFARDRYDSAVYKTKLKKNGIRVLSARENISDDASGVLMEAVLEGMAEYYSKELGQKIKRGMDINASKCLSTGSGVALGFKINKDTKEYEIDEEKAVIVKKIFDMYSTGSTMAEIIRYLNNKNLKTSRGNEFNKNSINRILTNKRYIGTYTYNGHEYENGIPSIISDKLFCEVQDMIKKKKKAPARAKANEEYILTTKLFCGHCKVGMTGIAGTSKTGTSHYYYQCINNRKHKCDKKNVQKKHIEDIVIDEALHILTDKNIDKIAKQIVTLCAKDKNTSNLKSLEKQLKDNIKATDNILNAIKLGKVADILLGELEKIEAEKTQITTQIEIEKSKYIDITVDHIKYFLEQFKKGNINDIKFRKSLIDTFVNKIYLYDKKMTILFNTQDSHSNIDLTEQSSSMVNLVESTGVEPVSKIFLVIASTSLVRIKFH